MDSLAPAQLERLAVFPLPGVVFFPRTMLPLQIFEPRYRAMTARLIEDAAPVAVPLIRADAGDPRVEQFGEPPFHAIAGVGTLAQHQTMPDGRYRILLRGVARVRLTEIERDTPWRQARASLMPDLDPGPAGPALVSTLEAISAGLGAAWPRGYSMIRGLLSQTRDPSVISNCLASALWPDAESRQALLEIPDVEARMSQVIDRLAAVMADVGSGEGPVH